MAGSATADEMDEYLQLFRKLELSLHELPIGVLADEAGCAELMRLSYRLEALSVVLGRDIAQFIADCRWHFERYPHYLSRHKHFDSSYENYIRKYNGPLGTSSLRRPSPAEWERLQERLSAKRSDGA